ncbi:hypothetical protein H3005_10080 [Stenotrophomonas sp. Br8]|nr:hypothetical protein [Stenotrophomonas sp. Br8]MBD3682211.1 hypothetical protein [Stenotrophomonas sp. Br8]
MGKLLWVNKVDSAKEPSCMREIDAQQVLHVEAADDYVRYLVSAICRITR